MKPGIYTALITPFTEEGAVDEGALRELIHFQLDHGVDGIVVLGTTGEAPTLTSQEKERIIRIAREEIKGDRLLIVGTGNYSTAKTIEETKRAQDLGAEIALVVTPYYNKPTQEGLFKHFEALAKAVAIPLLPYNIQGRTSLNLQTETLKRLAEIPKIIGVKEASGSIVQMMDVIEQIFPVRPDFLVFSGDDNLTLPLISLGGHGVVSVVSNLIPHLIKEMVAFALCSNFEEARKLHYDLFPFFKAAFIETNPIPIKTMMRLSGMKSGPCRLPLCPLIPENERKVSEILQKNALISSNFSLKN